jgi:RNA polymerase sigma factor (sigma-70 family)
LDDLNNRAFVEKVRGGDPTSFQILFDRLLPKLCSFLTKDFGLQPHDAEEIASEAMVKVHKSVGRFNINGGAKLTTWIFQIARNTAIDHLRKRTAQEKKATAATPSDQSAEDVEVVIKSKKTSEDFYEMNNPTEEAEHSPSPEMEKMLRAFDSISEQDRDILRMHRVMDYDEIATVENISVNNARVRRDRAEDRLRAAYEKEKKDER